MFHVKYAPSNMAGSFMQLPPKMLSQPETAFALQGGSAAASAAEPYGSAAAWLEPNGSAAAAAAAEPNGSAAAAEPDGSAAAAEPLLALEDGVVEWTVLQHI